MDITNVEANNSVSSVLVMSINVHSINLTEPLKGIMGKFLFVLKDVIHPQSGYIIEGFSKSVSSYIVGGSSLKLQWWTLKGGLPKADMFYHLATTLVWRHLIEPLLFTIKNAYTRRTIDLMPTESKEVTI